MEGKRDMKKTEIPKARDNDLIEDYVSSYATLLLNYNASRGIIQVEKHCKDLETELLKRGILTEENIKALSI